MQNLASIVTSNSALLFALDLDYEADPTEKIFRFDPHRPARFEFALPPFLQKPKDIFRIDADGVYEVRYESIPHGVRIEDRTSKVAIYVAAKEPGLREQLASRRRELLQFEQSFQFDPANNDLDFEALKSFLESN